MSNHITITGKIGQEPELKFSQSGLAILTFSIADSYGKDDKKKTTWHNITVFGQLAEHVSNSVTKGDTVIVVGRYEQDEYTKKDGTKGKSVKVIADEVGCSCRWNAWVKDRTNETISQIGKSFPSMKAVPSDNSDLSF